MRSIELTEHSAITCRLEPQVARYLERHFPRALSLKPAAGQGRYVLQAQSHVGTVVAPGVEIRIRAKCRVRSLFYMLGYAYHLADFRRELSFHDSKEGLYEHLLAIFAGQLEALLGRGLRRGYLEEEDDLQILRGRMIFDRQLRRRAVGVFSISCRFQDFTADIPHNQVLRYALHQVGSSRRIPLDARLRRLRRAFSVVSLKSFRPGEIERLEYDRMTAHYRSAHTLAWLLLKGRGAEHERGAHPMGSFLVDMNRLFEDFVAAWLKAHLPEGWRVAAQRSAWLDREKHLRIRPDLVLEHLGVPTLVADTKYKLDRAPASQDAFQILAYARALELPRGALIYPQRIESPMAYVVRDGHNEIVMDGVSLEGTPEVLESEMVALWERLRA